MNIWTDANGWPIPPVILIGCLVAEILYFRGWRLLLFEEQAKEIACNPDVASLSGIGAYRKNRWFWRGALFLCALVALLVAAMAPVDLFASQFFWVHMVQHLLLLVVMAPLLVASAPLLPWWLGLPEGARAFLRRCATRNVKRPFLRVGSWLRNPAISCALLIVGTWVWHWPPLYNLALTNDIIHDWCEHLTFMLVSVLFWTQVIPSAPLQTRTGYLGRLGCVGVAIVQNLVLAVLLGFASIPLYTYAHMTHWPGGLSALQDQQIGAGIMWTFGDLPFGIAFSILVQQWFAASEANDATSAAEPQRVHTEIGIAENTASL